MPRIKANGIELEYRETGSPDDPMLLLVSGFSAQMITFPQELLDGLASAGRRVVIFDNRDIGLTTELEGQTPPSPRDIVKGIAAGEPIEVIEAPEQVDLAELLPMGKDHYALRVRGTSMIDDGIHDGDLVIVERREQADDGELVVAIVPGEEMEEATLKKLFRDKKDGRDVYRLQPSNEALEPLIVDQVEIRGVVVGVVRRYPRWSDGSPAE